MKQVVESLVDGGKASAGPPLGPALGPMGVNIGQIVAKINEKTKDFQGMKVPVKVIIDPATKQFEIEVGVPPTSALVLKEAGIDKGSGDAKVDLVGNLNVEQVVRIAKMKRDSMLASTLKAASKEVIGTCLSMGVTVEGKPAREILENIDTGQYDNNFEE